MAVSLFFRLKNTLKMLGLETATDGITPPYVLYEQKLHKYIGFI